MDKKAYNFSADFIRVVAIIGVIIIHTANAVFGRPDYFGGISWWIAVILNSVSRASIPLFIMVSGYFILGKHETFSKTLKRTTTRLAIPLLFWLIFYTVWNGGSPTLQYLNFSLITRLLTVNVIIFYFFIILIGLYLATPFLRKYLLNQNKISQVNLALLLLFAGCVYYFIQYYFSLCSPTNSLIYWVPFAGIFVAGFVFGRKNLSNKTWIAGLYFLSLLVTAAGAYYYYLLTNNGNSTLNAHGCLTFYTDSYLSFNVVLLSVSSFIFLMQTNFDWLLKFEKLKTLIFSVARASLGIYVLHIFFLDILDRKLNLFIWITPVWLYLIVKIVTILFVSCIAALIIMKIPLLKRTLGEK